MAKAKSTAKAESQKVSGEILRDLDELSVGISKVRGTASCVQHALWIPGDPRARDLSICIREHVVKELRRLHRQTQNLMVAVGGRLPFPDEDPDDVID